MLRSTVFVSTAIVASFASSLASAGVVNTSSTFDADSVSRNYFSSDTYYVGYYASRDVVAGLSKFDPSLGNLTGIKLSVDFDYTYTNSLNAGTITDPGQAHQAQGDFTNTNFLVAFRPNTSATTLVGNGPAAVTLSANGGAGAAAGSDGRSGGGSTQATLVDITSNVDLSEFIGTGDVTALIVATYLPYSIGFTLNNLDDASAASTGDRTGGTISLQYTYAVPEPTTLAALALAMPLLGRRRGSRLA